MTHQGELNRMQYPHLRFNPLQREWVLVSPERMDRPWLGQVETVALGSVPAFDPTCYLCPGNERAGGTKNPMYETIFVFENDFAALLPSTPRMDQDRCGLLVARSERGLCRVVCFSPRHDLTLATMSREEIRKVVDVWVEQYRELGQEPWTKYVLLFENRGAMTHTSNPHPHCQIWANATVPNEPAREEASFLDYHHQYGACLLCKYLQVETESKERLVCENEQFAALVPFWAMWPFETLVISKHHIRAMDEFSDLGRDGLADILKRMTMRYDNVFEVPFPYSMGFHQRPTNGQPHKEWHFHAHFYPPLLRSATVRKFMVGYELLGSPQRDITPEWAAARLREVGKTE
jgi:UDPglucose--hexose-1-phosphate uridylyltransferase